MIQRPSDLPERPVTPAQGRRVIEDSGAFALAVLTALTGGRTAVDWFTICPLLMSGSAVLLLIASSV